MCPIVAPYKTRRLDSGLGILLHLLALGAPREVNDRDEEKAAECVSTATKPFFTVTRNALPVRVIQHACQSVVPRRESGQQAKEAAGLDDRLAGLAHGVAVQPADAQEEEGQVEEEEEAEEGNGGPQRGDEQEEREDEPALFH